MISFFRNVGTLFNRVHSNDADNQHIPCLNFGGSYIFLTNPFELLLFSRFYAVFRGISLKGISEH